MSCFISRSLKLFIQFSLYSMISTISFRQSPSFVTNDLIAFPSGNALIQLSLNLNIEAFWDLILYHFKLNSNTRKLAYLCSLLFQVSRFGISTHLHLIVSLVGRSGSRSAKSTTIHLASYSLCTSSVKLLSFAFSSKQIKF